MSQQRASTRIPPSGAKATARVITRTGDRGATSLFGPGRVRKTDPRVAALGDLDEAQAVLGVARARLRGELATAALECQRGLYLVMAEVATPRAARLARRIGESDLAALDSLAETLRGKAGAKPRFVIPGETIRSAALDHARTVARRGERAVVGLVDARLVDGTHLLPWLNRLSDVLFLAARASEARARPAKPNP